MSDGALPGWVSDLCEPRAHPGAPADVELVQTQISYVFLAGDLVYKAKKPVDFGFIEQLSLVTAWRVVNGCSDGLQDVGHVTHEWVATGLAQKQIWVAPHRVDVMDTGQLVRNGIDTSAS